MRISACIITFNEENNIAEAVESVSWADEILIVDSESADRTRKIGESLGAKVLVKSWSGFSKQKQFAVDNAAYDWIFSLDADERVSKELKSEISELKKLPSKDLADGYKIPRLSFYMNRPIRHGSWYPDWQLRFFNRQRGAWKDVLIHESFKLDKSAKLQALSGNIFHYSVKSAAQHHQLIGNRYAPLAAKQMFESGKRTSPGKIATVGMTTFIQNYLLKRGFLDGIPGFCIARFAAHHAFLKHVLLWELQNPEINKADTEPNP